jgi:LuxR family maltose regulon positive regulatory protein
MTRNRIREIRNAIPFYFSERLKADLAVLPETPLTIVEAPVGYGKTTAVREFLDRNGIRRLWAPVLAPSGVSENAFWRHFCRVLESFPETAAVAPSLAQIGFPRDPARFETALELLHQLRITLPTVLVVDDFHLLPSPDFGALCEALAQEAHAGMGIPNLHIALVTRHVYPGKIERLRQMDACGFIGPESFLFTIEDVQGYCGLRELNISREQIRALHAATGGWISGLNIHLQHYRDHGSLFLPAPGKNRFAVSSEDKLPPEQALILEEEIYAPLPAEIKNLLFALCPLERFTVHQADFIYDGGTRELLAELTRQNSFVALDAGSGVYSLHSIFRYFLMRLFEALPPERQRDIRRRCGDWFAREGEFVAAMEQYYTIRDFEKALTVMEQDMARNLVTENAAFFTQMFQDCPEDVLARHPGAAFKHALAALAVSDIPAFQDRCGRLAKQCAAMPENDPQTRIWRGELEMLLALTDYNDIAAMSARHVRGYALMGRPTGLYPPESTWTMGCPSVLFMFHRESGKLQENVRLLHTTLPRYYLAAAYHGAGGEYLFEAESLYHAGDFAAASIVCHKAENMAGEHRQVCNLLCVLFLRLRLAVAAGDLPEAREQVQAMRGLIAGSRDYFLLHTVELCAGWLYAATGQAEKIPAWIGADANAGTSNRMYAFAKGSWFFVHATALLPTGQYGKVIGLFGRLLESGVFGKHRLFFIYAHIYLAAAHHGLGDKIRAVDSLRIALDAALPDSLYMPFVENSDFLLPVLNSLNRGRPRKGLRSIHALGETWRMNIMAIQRGLSVQPVPLRALLTPKQLEQAIMGADGKSHKDMAALRGVSPATIKKTYANIYARTGVNNRETLRTLLTEQRLIAG